MTNVPPFTEDMSTDKQELLALLLQQAGEEYTPFPLSFAQQRLWFLHQLDPDSPFYNMPIAVRLQGRLNRQALIDSLNAIIERHESLRTTFAVVDEQPLQLIAAQGRLMLRELDLSGQVAAEQETELWRILAEEARQPFDLAQGPLLRVLLLRLSDREHVLLLTLHHIIADGWSLGVLVRELAVFYQAGLTGSPAVLPELEIQYADFAQWQRDELQGELLESQLAYWKDQLAGPLPVLDLPTDHPRPAAPTFQGAHHVFTIAQPLVDALKALCRQEGVTPFMALLAVLKTVLYRYTGQSDVLVGTPIAGRNQEAIEPLIGFFVNTLVLRTDLSSRIPSGCSFRALLGRVRSVTLGAYEHQDLPFEKLVEELQPQRSRNHNPLFQVMFVLQNAPMPALQLPDLTLSTFNLDSGTAKFDLLLAIEETEDGLRAEIEYGTELFEPSTIERLAGHFQTVLAAAIAQPDLSIADLPLLTTAEQELMRAWNMTEVPRPPAGLLHELFTAQAARTPDAIAVVFEEDCLSYRELNDRANQLAQHLQGLGVKPESLVGVYMERSLELIVALLGVLKAGAAYVPLDPGYPRERLQWMLSDAEVAVVLTQDRLQATLPASTATIVALDADWPQIAVQPSTPPETEVQSEHPAYVIYTSGSTGRPKGVVICHRAIVSHMRWIADAFPLDSNDRTLQKSSISFDASIWEVYTPLILGAQLVLARPGGQQDPAYLVETIQRRRITVLQVVPSMLRVLLDEPGIADCRELRWLCVGGEVLPRAWAEQAAKLLPGAAIFNLYGPTEATIEATVGAWNAEQRSSSVPIGRPIANTQVYLVDAEMQPVPIGVPGELLIGGDGLARGYRNRPDLTAERFIPDRFGQVRGARLYRTGDRARFLPDGQIEYLGRIDHQVKLRGFRIELGEIEAVLRQQEAVREAAVVLREDQPGDTRLVAYVVEEPRTKNLEPRTGDVTALLAASDALPSPDATEAEACRGSGKGLGVRASGEGLSSTLRSYLSQRLPAYMIPSAFVFLDALPMTANDKLDTRALPAPVATPDTAQVAAAPRTPTEELLMTIWARVLGRERIGVHENFFALGGHSLLATRVIAQVRSAFQVDLPLTSLFASPTVADMARQIEVAVHARQALTIPPIHPTGVDRAPLSFFQHRFWMADQQDRGNPAFNMPTAVRLKGRLDLDALEYSLNTVVQRQAALRTIFVGDPPQQLILPATPMPLPVIDLRAHEQPEQALRRLVTAESQHRFDLQTGPLFRCCVARLHLEDTRQEHVLLLTIHHIVADGWSMGVLVRELTTVYAAVVQRAPDDRAHALPVALPPLPIQYADYALWERQWLQGETIERLLGYWRQQLMPPGAPMSPFLALPTDYPRGEKRTFAGGHQSLRLPADLSAQVQALSRAESCTLFMTLLAAFNVLLWRVSSDTDMMVGTPSAGRALAETEHLVGLFLNMLPLRTRLVPEQTFLALLGHVRETTLGAYTHQYLPMTVLVNALDLPHDPRYSPLFQVSLNMLNVPDMQIELPGLTIEGVPPDDHGSKLDFTIYAQEIEGTIQFDLVYNSDLFMAARMEALLLQFQALLAAIVVDPARQLAQLG